MKGLHDDYLTFHRLAVRSGDIDPVYPVLRCLARELSWTPEHTVRAVFTHVAFYDLGSTLLALSAGWPRFESMSLDLPCATERRAHRQKLRLKLHLQYLDTVARSHGGLLPWIREAIAGSPQQAWQSVTDRCLMRVEGNGRWASYKTAEMLAEVCGLPLTAPDMNHAHSSGPREGLELLYPELSIIHGRNDPATVRHLDDYSLSLLGWMAAQGESPKMEQAETTLCDFHSLVQGRYYIGHDIDQMQQQLTRTPSPLLPLAWNARQAVFDHRYLGEVGGWSGPDKTLRRAYLDHRVILGRAAA